jgi:hypothetical protein
MNRLLDASLPVFDLDALVVPRVARQHICFIEKEGEETPEPAPEPKPGEEGQTPEPKEGEQEPEPEPDPAPAAAKMEPAWKIAAMQRRIDKLTARLAAAEPKPAPGQQTADGKPLFTEEQAQQMAREMAQQENERQAFDEACGEVVRTGKQLFADDWQPRLDALLELRDERDPDSVVAYNTFIQAAVASGAGAQLIHDLAGDLNEAQRIMALSPIKMTAELTKRAAKLEAASKPAPSDVTNAPKPITPIGGRKAGTFDEIHPDDPSRASKLSSAEWFARRSKQVEERGLR